jgi:hypothetical protein
MSTQVQFRRGTTGETASFVGAEGEVTVDTVKHTCVVHDAFQVGGYPLLREDGTNSSFSLGSLSSCALKFANDPNTGIISPGQDQLALVTGGVARVSVDSAGAVTIPGNLAVTGNLTVTGTFVGTGFLPTTGGTLTGDLLLDNQRDLRFGEATANGTNWVAFQAPSAIATNVTWTLPNADATVSGHALKSDGAGNLSWGTAGGATGGGTDDIFYENSQTVTTNYTLTAGKNAMTAGPVTINSGVTVTVPAGASWVVV